jgi:Flp pilus assembly protein CpaB
MPRGRLLILIALLLVITVVGVFLAFAASRGGLGGLLGGTGQTNGNQGGEPTPVPVTATPEQVLRIIGASQTLGRGVIIPTEALVAIPWPTNIVPPSAITDPAQIVGTRARYTIARGEPIFSTMIVESLAQLSPTGSDAAAQIPAGYVAISIPYNRQHGVALGVKDGDHVNLIVSWAVVDIDQDFQTLLPNLSTVLSPPNPDAVFAIPPSSVSVVNSGNANQSQPVGRGATGVEIDANFYVVPSEPQRPRLVTQGIIQDALVLRVGTFGEDKPQTVEPTPTADPGATASAPPPPTSTPLPPDIITLVVSPQDAIVLNYVNRLAERYPQGVQVTFALRSAGDTSRVDTEAVTLSYMFEKFNIALPAKLNYGLSAEVVPTAAPPAP